MAREHARILCAIWRPGSDFRDRSPEAQRLYMLLLSQYELNNAGVMPIMVSKWARCSAGTTIEDVEKALAELVEHRYTVVDRATEELLIRSFMRRDKILNHPYTRRSALRAAERIESDLLRREVALELLRIGHAEGVVVASRLDPEPTSTPREQPVAMGSPTTRLDGIAMGSHEPPKQPIATGTSTTHRDGYSRGAETTHPDGEGGRGGGRERGFVPVPENSVGGVAGAGEHAPARTGTREATPPPPAPPPNLDPNNPRCGRHRDIPAGDPGPDCRHCRDVRLSLTGRDAAVDPRAAQFAALRAAIEACPDCDEHGDLEIGDYDAVRCAHPNLVTATPGEP